MNCLLNPVDFHTYNNCARTFYNALNITNNSNEQLQLPGPNSSWLPYSKSSFEIYLRDETTFAPFMSIEHLKINYKLFYSIIKAIWEFSDIPLPCVSTILNENITKLISSNLLQKDKHSFTLRYVVSPLHTPEGALFASQLQLIDLISYTALPIPCLTSACILQTITLLYKVFGVYLTDQMLLSELHATPPHIVTIDNTSYLTFNPNLLIHHPRLCFQMLLKYYNHYPIIWKYTKSFLLQLLGGSLLGIFLYPPTHPERIFELQELQHFNTIQYLECPTFTSFYSLNPVQRIDSLSTYIIDTGHILPFITGVGLSVSKIIFYELDEIRKAVGALEAYNTFQTIVHHLQTYKLFITQNGKIGTSKVPDKIENITLYETKYKISPLYALTLYKSKVLMPLFRDCFFLFTKANLASLNLQPGIDLPDLPLFAHCDIILGPQGKMTYRRQCTVANTFYY